MMVPTIHLNGTNGEQLLEQNKTAWNAVRDALKALADAAPNARDYYVQGSDAYAQAALEYRSRAERLQRVEAELETLTLSIMDVVEAREQARQARR